MKKFLPLLLLLGMGSSAYAGGIVSSHTSSVQLTVDAARTCLLYTSDAADDP